MDGASGVAAFSSDIPEPDVYSGSLPWPCLCQLGVVRFSVHGQATRHKVLDELTRIIRHVSRYLNRC